MYIGGGLLGAIVLNRTTRHWYTRIAAAPPWQSLSANQSVPILCGLI